MVKLLIVLDGKDGGAESSKETVEILISNRNADRLMKAKERMGSPEYYTIGIELFDDDQQKRRHHRHL